MSTWQKIAKELKQAEKDSIAIGQITKTNQGLSVDDAYKIQLLNIEKEISAGREIRGKKIGLTSLAMQNLLEVNEPDYGHLLDSMEVRVNTVERSTMLQPRVEGEIAFILKKDLIGPEVSVQDVLDATDYVVAAIEIVDSRILDWKLTIIDTVADNASSGKYLISDKKVDPNTVDLKKTSMNLYKNGELINSGRGEDVLGNPAYCVAWLANKLWEYGVELRKGEVILSGALSAMVPAEKGDKFTVEFSELGDISIKFV